MPRRGKRERRAPLAAVATALASLVFYLPWLGEADFVGDDEAFDAGFVREMAEHGHWLFPEFNGEDLPPKPPLFYWASALVSTIAGGTSEQTVRLPSALFGAGTVGLTVAAAARLVEPPGAVLAGLGLAVMPIFHDQARSGRADMTMTFFVTACLFSFLLAPDPLPRRTRWTFFVLFALAVLAKGAAPLGLVATVLVAGALATGRGRSLLALVHPAAFAFVAIVGSWYALGAFHWGTRFVEEHVIGENLRHFLGGGALSSTETGLARNLRYFLYIFTGTLPWGFFLPVAMTSVWRSSDPETAARLRFLVVWVLAGLVFFTLATRKSPYYLLPLFPPVAILVAAWARGPVVEAFSRDGWRDALPGREILLGFAVTAIALPLWWWGFDAEGVDALEAQALAAVVREAPLVACVVVAAMVVAVSTAAVTAHRRDWGRSIPSAWAAMAILVLVLDRIEGPLDDSRSMRDFAEAIEREVEPGVPVYFYRRRVPGIVIYADRQMPTLEAGEMPPEAPFHLVVPEAYAEDVPSGWRRGAEVVLAQEGQVFTRRRQGIRLLRIVSL